MAVCVEQLDPVVPFGMSISRSGDHDVLAVAGEVDVATAPRVYRAVRGLVAQGRVRIVVDLCGVTFIDASGLGVLMAARHKVDRAGGSLCVVPNAVCARLLRLTGTTGLLTF